jgi:hypothetical protein
MSDSTYIITLIAGILAGIFTIAVVVAFFVFLKLYSRETEKRHTELKARGKRGEAVIVRLPRPKMDAAGSNSLYSIVPIGLEIRVPGIAPYEIDKEFTIPTSSVRFLEIGKTVSVWIDPNNPRNTESIVFEVE